MIDTTIVFIESSESLGRRKRGRGRRRLSGRNAKRLLYYCKSCRHHNARSKLSCIFANGMSAQSAGDYAEVLQNYYHYNELLARRMRATHMQMFDCTVIMLGALVVRKKGIAEERQHFGFDAVCESVVLPSSAYAGFCANKCDTLGSDRTRSVWSDLWSWGMHQRWAMSSILP